MHLLMCSRHGITEHRINGEKRKCKKCDYLYTKRYKEKNKLEAISYGGGCCQKCGYDKCIDSLHFHHIDPSKKEFGIFESRPGYKKVRNIELLKKEMDKCILLCANCHMEIHSEDERIIHEEIKIKLTKSDIE